MSVENRLAKLKQEVRGVILSSSRGLTLNQFLKDYKDSIGKPFPYQELGYGSIPDLLRDISDVVRLNPGYSGLPSVLVPVTNEKVNHINTMVAKQKQIQNKFISRVVVPRRSIQEEADIKNIRKPVQLPLESKNTHYETHSEKGTVNMSKDSHPFNGYQENAESSNYSNSYEDSRLYKSQDSYEGEPSASRYSSNEYQISDPYHNQTNEFSNYSQDNIHNGDYDAMQEDDFVRPPTPGELIITEKMKNDFRDLLDDFYPEGIPSSKFCKLYKEKFGVPLHYFNYGLKSFKEMIASVPDVFTYQQQRSSNQDWILFNTSKYVAPTPDRQRWIPCDISKNISDLAQEFPSGLKKTEFVVLYRERFNAELDVHRLGFSSLDSFLQSCSDIDYVNIDGEDRVIPGDIYQTSTSVDIESSYALPSVAEMKCLWGGDFGDDECNPSMSYHPFKLIKRDKLNYAKVYACDVINPSKIWLQMDDQREDLNRLMFNLNEYYDKNEHKHNLKNNTLAIKDLICTVRFVMDNRWHRAKIVSEGGSSDQVSVLYVDYGTENVVMTNCVRKLRKDFYSLPVQAIQASLYGLMPNPKDDSKWTPECTDFFYDLSIEKKFNIDVMEIDETIPKLEVILHDGKNSLTINDQLLAAGHAISIGHMPLMESEDMISEMNEDEISGNIAYSSMLQEPLSIQSSGGDDRRIRTPPGYSSRAAPTLVSSKAIHNSTSSSTCERIKDLREDAMNLWKKAERLLDVAKQKCLEANVLEHHVCKHPHVAKEGMAHLSKWLLSQSEPILGFCIRDIDQESNCSSKLENISVDFKNHSKGMMTPFNQEPSSSFGMPQGPGPHEFNQLQTYANGMNHTAGTEPRFNSMTENTPHHHQMISHPQHPPSHHQHTSNRLPAINDQQLPFQSYPPHQQIPPNLVHNKMVGQPLIVKNQPSYMAGRFPYPPYHQQNIIYPQNMGQWGGQWGGHPPMPGHPAMAGPPTMTGPPVMSGPPNVYPPYRHQLVFHTKPIARSNQNKFEESSCPPVTVNESSKKDGPLNQLSQHSMQPEENSAEYTSEVDFLPSAPNEDEINTPLPDSHSELINPENDVASSSATSPCFISTSHLNQKQVKKLENTGDIIVPPPPTNNWSELLPSSNFTSCSTSKCVTPVSSTSADFPNHSLLNLVNDEKSVEEEKLDDACGKLDDLTERLVESKLVVNHIMKICVQNILGKSSNMLLLLVEDSVAVLLRQLYLCYWWGEIKGEEQCYDDFMVKLKETHLPSYSIFYSDYIPIFDRLREDNLIAEDDLYVHVVNLCDVSYILDFVCPIEKHDLSHIKNIFKELSELVLPVDEFWYKNEMTSEQ